MITSELRGRVPLRQTPHGLMPGPGMLDVLRGAEVADIRRAFADDPWLSNALVNAWEEDRQLEHLTAYPLHLELSLGDYCNAKCTFCSTGPRFLPVAAFDSLEPAIRGAESISLGVAGEPLTHPSFDHILAQLGRWLDPRARASIVTNGVFLRAFLDALLSARVWHYHVSLHAATSATYERVVGLSAAQFDEALAGVRALVRARDGGLPIRVGIAMVVVRETVGEADRFVELGNELRVDEVHLKALHSSGTPSGVAGVDSNYPLLPIHAPRFAEHREAVLRAVARSAVPVHAAPESWENQGTGWLEVASLRQEEDLLAAEERVGPAREAPLRCAAPYRHLIARDGTLDLAPCHYITRVPGHAPGVAGQPLLAHWNSASHVEVRRRLRAGPLLRACERCPAPLS